MAASAEQMSIVSNAAYPTLSTAVNDAKNKFDEKLKMSKNRNNALLAMINITRAIITQNILMIVLNMVLMVISFIMGDTQMTQFALIFISPINVTMKLGFFIIKLLDELFVNSVRNIEFIYMGIKCAEYFVLSFATIG